MVNYQFGKGRGLTAFAALTLISAFGFQPAYAELQYAEDRDSEVYSAVDSDEAPQIVIKQNIESESSATADASANSMSGRFNEGERPTMSRAELLRRKRIREELKNEDILQERLESLRLRDEERRTAEVLGNSRNAGGMAAQDEEMTPAPVMQSQTVVTPVTERPGQPAPTVEVVQVASAAPAGESRAYVDFEDEQSSFSISPRFGMPNMINTDYISVAGRYSAGLGLNIESSDQLSFELGYTYNEYGVASSPYNPFFNANPMFQPTEKFMMKQNVFDAGLKLHFLGKNAKLRPFISGGGAYSMGFVNYDQRIVDMVRRWNPNQAADYEVNSFLGYLGTGVDVKLTQSVSVGAGIKYYRVLTARENQPFNNYLFSPYGQAYTYPQYGYSAVDAEKQAVSTSMAWSNFYNISAGVNFAF